MRVTSFLRQLLQTLTTALGLSSPAAPWQPMLLFQRFRPSCRALFSGNTSKLTCITSQLSLLPALHIQIL